MSLSHPHKCSVTVPWASLPVEHYANYRSSFVADCTYAMRRARQQTIRCLVAGLKDVALFTMDWSQHAQQLVLSMVRTCLQVFDMLMAADVSYSSSLLGKLFSVSQLSDECFDILQLDINLGETNGISYLVLADCLRRASSSIRQHNLAAPMHFSTARRPTEKSLWRPTHFDLDSVLLAVGTFPEVNASGRGNQQLLATMSTAAPSCFYAPGH